MVGQRDTMSADYLALQSVKLMVAVMVLKRSCFLLDQVFLRYFLSAVVADGSLVSLERGLVTLLADGLLALLESERQVER